MRRGATLVGTLAAIWLSMCLASAQHQLPVPVGLLLRGGSAGANVPQVNWNPGLYLMTYSNALEYGSTTYSGSQEQTDISNTESCEPNCIGYAFFAQWSFLEGGSSGTQGTYPNVANNGTSFMAALMADAASKGVHIIVLFEPDVITSGSPLLVPTSGAVVPAYILTSSTFGTAQVGSSGATPESPYTYGWVTQQTGGYGSNWMVNSNTLSAMEAAIQNFATQWDGNPYLEGFCVVADDVMYPYSGITNNTSYFTALQNLMEATKTYFSHTNICLQMAGQQATISQQMAQNLVQDGVLVSWSDTAGAPAWDDNYQSISFTGSLTNGQTSATLSSAINGWQGGTYPALLSNAQEVSMTVAFSSPYTAVTFSPAVSGSASASATISFAPVQLGPEQMAWLGVQSAGSSWTPPIPALQTYSSSIAFAEEGDLSNTIGTPVYGSGIFSVAQMVAACNGGSNLPSYNPVGYNCSHLLVSYGDSSVWPARLSSWEGTSGLTNTGYPSVYGAANPAATPTFSPAAGNYSSTQTVTISDVSPSPTIYYTTNGSTPTTGSSVYSSPLTVSSSETIKAIATAAGYGQSAVGSAAYTISGSGITVVQKVTLAPASGVASVSGTITGVTAGDAIVVVVSYLDNCCGTPASVNDGNSYTADFNSGPSRDQSVTSWSLFDAASGSHTIAISKASGATTADTAFTAVIYELSGVPTSDSYDSASAGANGSSAGPVTVTTGTLANSGDIVLGAAMVNAVVTGLTNPSGWTSDQSYSSSYPTAQFSHILPGSTSAVTADFSSISSANNWAVGAIAYEP